MESGGSCFEKGKGKWKKPKGKKNEKQTDRSRRQWTTTEEQVLLDKLQELVAKKWKADNGFKPGYQQKLERMMRKVMPHTDHRANPHINSKIITWKRYYGSLRTMFANNSGLGFNATTGLLDVEDEMWASIVRNDKNTTGMRNKEWPMYNAWLEIFGNDRATGQTSEDIYQMFNKIQEEEGVDEEAGDIGGESQSCHNETERGHADFGFDMDADSEAPPPASTTEVRLKSKKRASSNSAPIPDDAMVNVMERFVTSSDNRLGSLCSVLGYEANLGKARQEIFTMLNCIPKLNMDQKIDVSKILAKNPNYLEMFLGFPVDVRARYVYRLLRGDE